MSYRQLDLCSSEEVIGKLKSRLCHDLDRSNKIFTRWSNLRRNPPSPSFSRAQLEEVKVDILEIVLSLNGDFKLISNLSAILPPNFSIFCFPDQAEANKSHYFCVLSDSYGRWGEIYPTQLSNDDTVLEPVLTLDSLNITIGDTTLWASLVAESQKCGWSKYLLDLLTWELEFPRLEHGFREMALRLQLDLVVMIGNLPFTLHSNDLEYEQTLISSGPVPDLYRGTFAGRPVWVKTYPKCGQAEEGGNNGVARKILETVLRTSNLHHPAIVSWTSAKSNNPDQWVLVTPRLSSDLQSLYAKNSALVNTDQLKLCVMKDVVEGLGYLHWSGRWHGGLTMRCILFDCETSRCTLSQFAETLSSEAGLPEVECMDERNRPISGAPCSVPGAHVVDVNAFGELVSQLFPAVSPPAQSHELRSLEELASWLLLLRSPLPGRWPRWCYNINCVRALINNVTRRLSLVNKGGDVSALTASSTAKSNPEKGPIRQKLFCFSIFSSKAKKEKPSGRNVVEKGKKRVSSTNIGSNKRGSRILW